MKFSVVLVLTHGLLASCLPITKQTLNSYDLSEGTNSKDEVQGHSVDYWNPSELNSEDYWEPEESKYNDKHHSEHSSEETTVNNFESLQDYPLHTNEKPDSNEYWVSEFSKDFPMPPSEEYWEPSEYWEPTDVLEPNNSSDSEIIGISIGRGITTGGCSRGYYYDKHSRKCRPDGDIDYYYEDYNYS